MAHIWFQSSKGQWCHQPLVGDSFWLAPTLALAASPQAANSWAENEALDPHGAGPVQELAAPLASRASTNREGARRVDTGRSGHEHVGAVQLRRVEIEPHPVSVERLTMEAFLRSLVGRADAAPVAIRVARQQFVTRLVCTVCGEASAQSLWLDRVLARVPVACPKCAAPMAVSGFHALEWLDASVLRTGGAARSLARVGLSLGDVVSVRQAEQLRHPKSQREAGNAGGEGGDA